MTRHRDQVQLFAGEDDFRNLDAMAARLGRARPKESSLDFAERRGIDPTTPSSSLEDAKAVAEQLERKRIPEKVPVHHPGKSPGALGQPKTPAASVQKPTASAAAAKPQEPSTPATSPPRVETPEQKHRREVIEQALQQAARQGFTPEKLEQVRAEVERRLDKAAETVRKYREKMERDREEEKDKGRER
jgi:predicted ribosome quality control (RQC) complex YloA/Tae2 family protein